MPSVRTTAPPSAFRILGADLLASTGLNFRDRLLRQGTTCVWGSMRKSISRDRNIRMDIPNFSLAVVRRRQGDSNHELRPRLFDVHGWARFSRRASQLRVSSQMGAMHRASDLRSGESANEYPQTVRRKPL